MPQLKDQNIGESELLVSIIIVSFNNFQLLKNCVSSLQNFTYGINFEIIIVDNNSSEGKIEDVISENSKLKIIKNKTNEGFAKANNKAIEYANGKYILFLNNDTEFIEDTINIILNFVPKIEKDFIIGCRLLNKDGSNQVSIVDFTNLLNLFGESFFLYKLFPKSKLFNRNHLNYKKISQPIEVDYVKGAFLFCSGNLVKQLGGFDERFYFYSEEADLCYRAKKNGFHVIFYPGTSIVHLGNATAINNLWFFFKNQKTAKIQLFQKHFHGLKYFLAVCIYHAGILIRIPIYLFHGVLTLDLFLIKKSYYFFRQAFVFPKNNFK